jgi:hypothetical protein
LYSGPPSDFGRHCDRLGETGDWGTEKELLMKRRIRIAAASLMVAAGLIGVVAAPASAAPKTIKPAEALCTAQGGTFFFPVDHAIYVCAPPEGQTFSEAQLRAARALCEGAYGALGGTFRVLGPGEGGEGVPEGTYVC